MPYGYGPHSGSPGTSGFNHNTSRPFSTSLAGRGGVTLSASDAVKKLLVTQNPKPATDDTSLLRERYIELSREREGPLKRAQACAGLINPLLYPRGESTSGECFAATYAPFASEAGAGAQNLAAKLVLGLFPPDASFFRQPLSREALIQIEDLENQSASLAEGEDTYNTPSILVQSEQATQERDRILRSLIVGSGDYYHLFHPMYHALIAGSVLLCKNTLGPMKMFTLRDAVWRVDSQGQLVEAIIKEVLSPAEVKPKWLKRLAGSSDLETFHRKNISGLESFTRLVRYQDGYHIQVQILDEVFEDLEWVEPLGACPWFVLQWSKVRGSSYGQSYVDINHGLMAQLEEISGQFFKVSKAYSRSMIRFDPAGGLTPNTLADILSSGGDVISAKKEEIEFMVPGQGAQLLQSYLSILQGLKQEVRRLFLLDSAVVRHAERVTKEEIQKVSSELTSLLGSAFYQMGRPIQEWYLPCSGRGSVDKA
jgi:hypothetical protein